MEISLKQLEHVLALARYRHYGQAAESLGISQPALSRSVIALEKRLGLPVFERSRAGVALTDAGRLLLHHARDVRARTAELQADLDELSGRGLQRLSVVCGHYPAALTIGPALSRLMRERPEAQINMEVADWARGLQLLEQGACDLAIVELSAVGDEGGLKQELLNDQQVFAVVRPGHPLTARPQPTLDELLSYPWACSLIPSRAAQHLGPGPLAAGDFDEQTGAFIPKIVASSLATSLALVRDTDIVGIAPLSVAEPWLESARLELVRYSAVWMRLNYGFLWKADTPLTPVTRVFMDRVRDAEARERQHAAGLRARYGLGP